MSLGTIILIILIIALLGGFSGIGGGPFYGTGYYGGGGLGLVIVILLILLLLGKLLTGEDHDSADSLSAPIEGGDRRRLPAALQAPGHRIAVGCRAGRSRGGETFGRA